MAEQPLIDISPENWRIVRDILQRHVPDREVRAFGSRAKWTAKEFSDLDIAIIGDEPMSISLMADMREAFQESALPFKVDVVDWAGITPSFRRVIEEKNVVLLTKTTPTKGWGEARLDDLKAPTKGAFAMGPFGSRIKAENFGSSGVPVIKGGNLNGDFLDERSFDFLTEEKAAELSSSEARRLDLVITHRGTIGQVGIIPETSKYPKYIASQSQLKLTLDVNKVNPYFVYYFLRSPEGQHRLLANTSQVGVPAIAQALTSVRNILIPYPPKPVQDEIVSVLRSLDERIALIRDTNATLEAIAQALFKSWFVDFDPVRAKAEGREPEGVPPEVAELFPSQFEDSEIGEIPKGWHAMRLDDVCEINPSRRLAKNTISPYLEMSALPTKGHRPDHPVPRAFSSGTKFINGDSLLARITPCLENGKTAFVDFLREGEVGWGSTEYIVLRPKAPLPDYWAYLLSRYEPFRQFAIQAMVGTSGRQRVEVSRLAQYLVGVPGSGIGEAFASLVEPLQQRIAANDDAAKSLSAIRDALLPRLMAGNISVAEQACG